MPQRKGLGYYFFTFINKLSDMIIISIVFVLTCIPVITMGAAGTALYYTVQKVIKRGQGYLLAYDDEQLAVRQQRYHPLPR